MSKGYITSKVLVHFKKLNVAPSWIDELFKLLEGNNIPLTRLSRIQTTKSLNIILIYLTGDNRIISFTTGSNAGWDIT